MNFNDRISGQNSWDEEKSKLGKITSLFEENGLKIKAGSRLYRYIRILDAVEKGNDQSLPKEFNNKKLYQISTEIHQLYYGTVELSKSKVFNEWKEKLDFLVSGKELPEDDQDHTSRNYQFELYIAGLLNKSSLKPISAEPDIVINQDGRHFGIAIKRPNSYNRIKDNLRKAKDQIIKTTHPGIIILDITRISNAENLVTQADSISKVTDSLIWLLDHFFEKNYFAMKNITNDNQIFGIALHISCLCDIKGAPGYSSRIAIRNLCSEKSALMSNLNYFAQTLRHSFQ